MTTALPSPPRIAFTTTAQGVASAVHQPGAALDGLVLGIWDATTPATPETRSVEILSESAITLSLHYGAPVTLRHDGVAVTMGSHLTGMHDGAVGVDIPAGLGSVSIKLTPDGAARLLGLPPGELLDAHVELRDAMPAGEVDALEAGLAAATDGASRAALAETFLAGRLDRPGVGDALALDAARRIAATAGAIRVAELAASYDLGERQFERRFRATMGLAPKVYARIRRLEAVLQARQAGLEWSRAAAEAGFCDQAHLIRDFRSLTGRSPARFFRAMPAAHREVNSRLGMSVFSNTFFV